MGLHYTSRVARACSYQPRWQSDFSGTLQDIVYYSLLLLSSAVAILWKVKLSNGSLYSKLRVSRSVLSTGV